MADPVLPVGEILRRVGAKQLMTLYKLPAFTSADELLQLFGKAHGQLRKGGTVNTTTAARMLLQARVPALIMAVAYCRCTLTRAMLLFQEPICTALHRLSPSERQSTALELPSAISRPSSVAM